MPGGIDGQYWMYPLVNSVGHGVIVKEIKLYLLKRKEYEIVVSIFTVQLTQYVSH